MSMLSDVVTSRIQAQIEECHGRERDMEISKKADIIVEVDRAEALQQFCQENTWTANISIADMLEVVEIPKTMEVQKEAKFTISNKTNKRISTKNIKCRACSNATETISTATIANNGLNTFDVV